MSGFVLIDMERFPIINVSERVLLLVITMKSLSNDLIVEGIFFNRLTIPWNSIVP